jgi:hypothetical protein
LFINYVSCRVKRGTIIILKVSNVPERVQESYEKLDKQLDSILA